MCSPTKLLGIPDKLAGPVQADGKCVRTRQAQGDVPPDARTSSINNAFLTHVVRRHFLIDRSARNRRPVLPLALGTDLKCADTAARIGLNFPDVCREGTSEIRHHTQRWKRCAKPRSAAHCSRALRRSAPELVPRGRLFVPLIQRLSPGEQRDMVF